MNHKTDTEVDDARKVNETLQLLKQKDLVTARNKLEEVIANSPIQYVYRYLYGNKEFVKFWDQDEFLQYASEEGQNIEIKLDHDMNIINFTIFK